MLRLAEAGRTHGMSSPCIISKFELGFVRWFSPLQRLGCQSWVDSVYFWSCRRRQPDVLGNRWPPEFRGPCVTVLRKLTDVGLIDSIR